jgi:DNA-binding MarR family transcriptional regulator
MNKKASPAGNDAPATDTLLYSLLDAARALEKRMEEALGVAELSAPKYGVLTHLVEAGEPLSLSECASKMTCVRSNITQLMDRLEAEGLVRRIEDPNDRRAVRAAITPLGSKRQAVGAQQVRKVHEDFARSLGGVDPMALHKALAALQ